MPLTLVTGPPGSGKTERLYEVARAAQCTATPTVLLPTDADVRLTTSELVVRDSVTAVLIRQIDRFLDTAWEVHGDGRRLVTPLQRTMLLRTEIAISDVHEFTDSARTAGFLSLLERLAQEQSKDPILAGDGLAGGIARTIHGYRGALSREGLVERAEATELLAERARPEWFPGPVLANRFDDLTAAQERFLIAAAQAGAEVWIALTGEADRLATDATKAVIERLRTYADATVLTEATSNEGDELRDVGRVLFTSEQVSSVCGAVRLSVATGEESEAERVVAEVLEALSDGIPFGEMAVLYRDSRQHLPALKRAFSEAGVPAEYDAQSRFSETPLGGAIMALLDFATNGGRTPLVALLASGCAGICRDDVDELDSLWQRRPECTHDERMLNDLDRISPDARRFVRDAVRLASAGVRPENVDDWKDLAGALLAHAYGRQAPAFRQRDRDDARAHRMLCQAVEDLAGLHEFDESGLAKVGLREVLAGAWVSVGTHPEGDYVRVMDVERARGRRFRVIVMGGLVAGEFPRIVDEGVLESGRLHGSLLEQGLELPLPGGLDRERLLFYLAVTRATERLVLSRQEADSDGRTLRPSIFLEELLAAYGTSVADNAVLPERRLAYADLGLHRNAPSLPRRALRSLALSDGGEGVPQVARARARLARESDVLQDRALRESLEARKVFSATELEAYAACPYSWFYRTYLSPEPLGEYGEALVAGRIAHAALKAFYAALPATLGCNRVTPANANESVRLCDAQFEKVLQGVALGDEVRHLMLVDRTRARVHRLVSRDATFLPGFAPVHLEWPFGLEGDPPEEFAGFALCGRIDRIDVRSDSLVVIDYKMGKATPGAHFVDRCVLQAPLYAEVARRRLGGVVAGTLYRSLSATDSVALTRGAYDDVLIDGPELVKNDAMPLSTVMEDAIARAQSAAEGIRSGVIVKRPAHDGACAYCGVRSWCAEACTR